MSDPLIVDLFVPALVVGYLALWTDLAARRIPNGLTLTAIGCGLVLQLLLHGVPGLLLGGLGLLVGLLLLVGPFAIGAMGAGDVKLVAALGTLLGPLAVLVMLLAATLISGLIACVVAGRRRLLARALRGSLQLVRPRSPGEPAASVGRLPFAVPLAIALSLTPFLLASWLG